MDERTWLISADPQALLYCLIGSNASGAIPEPIMRQLRLFYLADWSSRPDSGWPSTLHKTDNLREARAWIDGNARARRSNDRWLLYHLTPQQLARDVARRSAHNAKDQMRLAALLREIFGNPWQAVIPQYGESSLKKIAATGSWQYPAAVFRGDWRTPTVKTLARAIYDEGRWDDLPILADALEDTGSDCQELLMHLRGQEPCWDSKCGPPRYQVRAHNCLSGCRGTGWIPLRHPHTWGCWAVDLLLPKENESISYQGE